MQPRYFNLAERERAAYINNETSALAMLEHCEEELLDETVSEYEFSLLKAELVDEQSKVDTQGSDLDTHREAWRFLAAYLRDTRPPTKAKMKAFADAIDAFIEDPSERCAMSRFEEAADRCFGIKP